MKLCGKCQIQKSLTEFHKDKQQKDGYGFYCKICRSDLAKIRNSKEDSVFKRKERYELFKLDRDKVEKRRQYRRDYYQKNKEKEKIRNKIYYLNNRELYRNISTKRARGIRLAKPSWYKKEKYIIEDIYRKREELSLLSGTQYHVDHVIPLINDKVCGLHCIDNLKIIKALDNLKKNNSFINT